VYTATSPDAGNNNVAVPSLTDLSSWVKRKTSSTSDGSTIEFVATTATQVITLIPLHQVDEQRYTVYYNMSTPSPPMLNAQPQK